MPHVDVEWLKKTAHWSDAFFNWEDGCFEDRSIEDAAKDFVKQFPKCPYPEEWLVKDYIKRL